MPANLENTAVATGLKRSVFIPIPKKGNAKECSKYCTIALISHASKLMLKILQTRLQQYMDRELPDVQAGFRKSRGSEDQIANICWIIEKAREYQKNIYFCFIDYAKAFDCVDHNKLWKILKAMGIPDHLAHLLRNLYADQEATVRTGHGTTDWFQIGKAVCQGCILSPCLFNFYAEYIMRNAGLEEAQAGIKIAGRNINNLRCADDTTLMAESEEELKSLLMKVKVESEKVGLKLNILKTMIKASCPITSWEIDGETEEILYINTYIWNPVLWPPHAKSWLIGKDSDVGRDWEQEETRTTEDEMAGWYHQLNGHEFGWTPGKCDEQGGLACCNSCGCKESCKTEWLNWTDVIEKDW